MMTEKMKAIAVTGYGSPDVLQLQEFEKPIPKEKEVLIKIIAAPVSAACAMMRKGTPYYARFFLGLKKPKNPIPGTGFAGTVEAVGNSVRTFQVGDEVFGETTTSFSTHAEYVCVPEDGIILKKPTNLTFEEAAPICDGPLTSLNFLQRMAKVQPGQKVLINGASGSLGTAAVQLAKHFGAEVTGVCSRPNFELVQSLGADKVIDYMAIDFTKTGETYNVIYDTIGGRSFLDCKKALTPNGIYLSPVLSMPLLFQVLRTSMFGKQKAKFDATGIRPAPELRKMLQELKGLLEHGKLKSIIDRRYALEQTAEAHRYVDTGRKKGNVVITLM